MKRKLVIFMTFILCLTSIFWNYTDVQAEELGAEIPFEEIVTEDAIIGDAPISPQGVYLMSGSSTINDAGDGKIGVGGVTTAALRCRVSVNTIVERYDDGWVRVTSYTNTREDALIATVSRALKVGSGYYYRVRSVHSANSDASNSCTDALLM